ncbi:MAG: D-tyrosyl-tRNA(Tyr) deacylase [Clostridia bacterium]|nr:D-tyrosyl-tRNA(Tyr) deacylase [Clostridia bacterium]
MRIVVQRVKNASVSIDGKVNGKIDQGLLVFLGIKEGDSTEDVDYLVRKISNLRIFSDDDGKMNLSVKDIGGEVLIISQFTLYAECKKSGNRPSFSDSAKPEVAIPLYEYFIRECNKIISNVQTGIFGADMKVELINDGPVTIILES